MNKKCVMPLVGGFAAVVSGALIMLGNPANMGLCIACFLRDTAGAVGLHSAAAVQYVRPEVLGILLGAFILSNVTKEFSAKGGSAPVTRFVLGFSVMIGALIFLGCPLRMLLRIAGGDLNAIVGLLGFVVGIIIGVFFLDVGYTLKRTYNVSRTDGFLSPIVALILLYLLTAYPSVLSLSSEGPGSMHAPVWASLSLGLIIGGVGFISRLCFVAGIRDYVLFKDFSMLSAFVAIIVVCMTGNLIFGKFELGFVGQPIAHTDGLWNFLGMMLTGLSSVLLGGCPFRQLILAGGGNSDSVVAVFGMIVGAAFAHNFKMASSAAGVTANGKIGFAVVFIIVILIAVNNSFGKWKASENG
jgi:YedE family putative selenium metabolism protein